MRWFKKKTDNSHAEPALEPRSLDEPTAALLQPPSGVTPLEESLAKEGLGHEIADEEFPIEPVAERTLAAINAAPLEVGSNAAPSTPAEAEAAAPTPLVKKKNGLLGKLTELATAKRGHKLKHSALPIRVIIGYLPEVTERDALEYAVGIAEKHFEQMGMAFFDAHKYANGFAYEVHEGGPGKAYLPDIIKYFDSLGAYRTGELNAVVLRTATRFVEVQRMREGLAAIILPESSTMAPTEWLEATASMRPAVNKRTALLVAGAALFVTGFVAMIVTSMLTRYQPYEPMPEQKVEFINATNMPFGQWPQLETVPRTSYVKALRYRNSRWEPPELATTAPPSSASTPSAPVKSGPGAAPELPPPGGGNAPKALQPAPLSLGTKGAQSGGQPVPLQVAPAAPLKGNIR